MSCYLRKPPRKRYWIFFYSSQLLETNQEQNSKRKLWEIPNVWISISLDLPYQHLLPSPLQQLLLLLLHLQTERVSHISRHNVTKHVTHLEMETTSDARIIFSWCDVRCIFDLDLSVNYQPSVCILIFHFIYIDIQRRRPFHTDNFKLNNICNTISYWRVEDRRGSRLVGWRII